MKIQENHVRNKGKFVEILCNIFSFYKENAEQSPHRFQQAAENIIDRSGDEI